MHRGNKSPALHLAPPSPSFPLIAVAPPPPSIPPPQNLLLLSLALELHDRGFIRRIFPVLVSDGSSMDAVTKQYEVDADIVNAETAQLLQVVSVLALLNACGRCDFLVFAHVRERGFCVLCSSRISNRRAAAAVIIMMLR